MSTAVPQYQISSLPLGEQKTEKSNVTNLIIYFIVIFIIAWIILYFLNPSIIQEVNHATEQHNGVPSNTKVFIWSVVIAIVVVAIIYFLRK